MTLQLTFAKLFASFAGVYYTLLYHSMTCGHLQVYHSLPKLANVDPRIHVRHKLCTKTTLQERMGGHSSITNHPMTSSCWDLSCCRKGGGGRLFASNRDPERGSEVALAGASRTEGPSTGRVASSTSLTLCKDQSIRWSAFSDSQMVMGRISFDMLM